MKKNIKRSDVVNIFNTLQTYTDVKDKVFSFFIKRNISLITPTIESIRGIYDDSKASDEYLEYDKKRIEICETYAKRDDNGDILNVNNNYIFEDIDTVKKLISDLASDYTEAIEEFEQLNIHVKELIEEEVEVDISPIPFNAIPGAINFYEFEALIKEDPEEIEKLIGDL